MPSKNGFKKAILSVSVAVLAIVVLAGVFHLISTQTTAWGIALGVFAGIASSLVPSSEEKCEIRQPAGWNGMIIYLGGENPELQKKIIEKLVNELKNQKQ